MQKKIKIGEVEIIHFYKPGKFLNDISLKKLHNGLIQVSVGVVNNSENRLFNNDLTLKEIREYLKYTIVAIGMVDKVPYGFLIHSINKLESLYEIKTDSFALSSNLGEGFNKLMLYGNLLYLYERIGTFLFFGNFNLKDTNVGKINWYKYMQIKLQFFIIRKELNEIIEDRDVECEMIKEIISYQKNNTEEKCV